jgi:hypothetical protein
MIYIFCHVYMTASEYVLRSAFANGSNYRLPLIGLSCESGVSHISECQFYNQTSGCNHKRTTGIICKGNKIHSDTDYVNYTLSCN